MHRYCRRVAFAAILALLPFAHQTAAQPAADPIVWRLKNPFRYFKNPEATERHIMAFQSLSAAERATPVTSIERVLGKEMDGRGWAEAVYKDVEDESCWYSHAAHMEAAGKTGCGAYVLPKSHTVQVTAPGLSGLCTWAVAGIAVPPQDCSKPRDLVIPYPAGADVTVIVDGQAKASRKIVVEDLLIVGLGDSFGSGEGNPDRAIVFQNSPHFDYPDATLQGYPLRKGVKTDIPQKHKTEQFKRQAAGWTHRNCHRSLYSQQLRSALHLAISDPLLQRSVTYLGFACTGATILDLFEAYQGRNEYQIALDPPHSARKLALSQLSMLAHALCAPGTAKKDETLDYNALEGRTQLLKLAKAPIHLYKCEPAERLRTIDALLLSIGGNDVGFSQLVANAALDPDYVGIPKLFVEDITIDPAQAEAYLKRLPGRYAALAAATKNVLGVTDGSRTYLTAYPTMGYTAPDRVCASGNDGMDVATAWQLDGDVIAETEQFVADEFTPAMADAAKAHGWTFVDAHRQKSLQAHGLCAKEASGADPALANVEFPRHSSATGAGWGSYKPSGFKPYAPTQRHFRTPNDAFLAVNFHSDEASIKTYTLPLQIASWSAYSGAFHPNALGHATIADAVVPLIEKQLAARPHPPR